LKTYYLVKISYLTRELFLIWYSDDIDGFVVKENKIVSFNSSEDATSFAAKSKIELNESITNYDIFDFTNIDNKITNTHVSENCRDLFDIWNLFGDIANSTNQNFIGNSDDEVTRAVYEKLFYGINLRVITKDMDEYHPKLDEEEREKCLAIFQNGLDILNQII
jgi:hypothetical protein